MTNRSQLFAFLKKPQTLTLAIVVLALSLRLPLLSGSLWMDEAAQALESIRPLTQQLQIRDDFQPPLLHLITHFALRISHSEWWLRWWGAVLPGVLTIWLVPSIAQTLFTIPNKTNTKISAGIIGSIAAFWLATNSFHVFFSQELRPYSLAALFAILSWLLLLKNSPRRWFILASLAGLYSTYLYPFVLIGQFGYLLLWDRKSWLSHLFTGALIILGFAPWMPSFFGQLQAGQQLRLDLPGWESVVSFSQLKVLPLLFGKWLFGLRDLALTWPWLSSLVIFFGLTSYISWNLWKSSENTTLRIEFQKLTKLVVGWGVIPLITAWVVSFWVPVIQPKRVLWLWPLGALLLAWLLVSAVCSKSSSTKVAGLILGVFLLILNVVGLTDYYSNPLLQREDWRGLQQKITQGYSPGSTILIFGFPAPFASWQWYDQNTFPSISTGYLSEKSPEYVHVLLNQVSEYRFVLVFDYLRTLTDPQNLILTSLESSGYKGVGVIDTPNIGFVRIYTRPDNLLGLNTNPGGLLSQSDQLNWVTSTIDLQGNNP